MKVRHTTPLWSVSVETNSLGRRDPEPAANDRRPVVLGIGDSFAFGWGVDRRESLFSQLGARQANDMRWVNASVPGSGPADQLRRLPTLLDETNPAVVVLAFFVGNDFADVRFGGTSRYEILDGMLVLRAPGESLVDRFKRDIIRRSRLLQAARAWQFSHGAEPGPANWDYWRREFADIHKAETIARHRDCSPDHSRVTREHATCVSTAGE